MRNPKWGVAAIVAALAFAGPANAQSSGSQTGSQSTRSDQSSQGQGSSASEGPSSSTRPGADSAAEHGTKTSPDPGGGASATGASSGSRDASQGTGSTSSSQGSGSGTMSQGSSARSGGQGQIDEKLSEAVQKLHASNQAEIHMGQMGAQNAQSPEVKQYAQKLADDHKKNDEQLTQLAQQKGINLQGEAFQKKQEKAQDHMKDLQGKTGAEFDEEYVKMMKKEHKDDVKDVEKAAKEARKQQQTELASFLDQTKTSLEGHLQEAERLEKSVGQSAQRQGRRGSSDTGRSGDTSGTGSGTTGSGTSGSTGSGSSSGSSSDSGSSSSSSGTGK